MHLPFSYLRLIAAISAIVSAPLVGGASAASSNPEAAPAHVLCVEGTKWRPDAGYVWAHPEDGSNTDVVWASGKKHSTYENVISGDEEGIWNPAPGFRFLNDVPGDFRVVWQSGRRHPVYSHVISGTRIGAWAPEGGYRFVTPAPDDLRVERCGPTEQQLKQACAGIVLALITNDIAHEKAETFLQAIVVGGAKTARDQLVLSSLNALFPDVPGSKLRTAANIITLAADNELTAENWQSRETVDAINARLSASSPGAGEAFELARFIGAVVGTYQSRN